MLSTVFPAALGSPNLVHVSDWNNVAWIIWWSLTVVAVAFFLFGVRSLNAYSERVPQVIGLPMTLIGYIFLFVAVAFMTSNSPDGQTVASIGLAFIIISAAAGIATAFAYDGWPKLGWVIGLLLGIWTIFITASELIGRIGLATGIAPIGIVGIILAVILIALSKDR